MKDLKFSIIIPVYNGEKYIKDCLDSVAAQTYTNYEVILINDGSTDNSSSILNQYTDENTIIIETKNNGLSVARNIGIDNASGDYIIFIDVDDTVNNELLLHIFTALEDKKYDMIRYQAREILDNQDTNKKTFITDAFLEKSGIDSMLGFVTKNEIFNPVWMYAYNLSLFKDNNLQFEPNILQEDFRFSPLALIQAKSVRSIDYIGYNYHLTENSIMRNNDYDKDVLKAFHMVDNYEFLLKNVVSKIDKIHDRNKVQIFLYKAVFRKIKYLKPFEKEKFIKELERMGEITMNGTNEFFKDIFNQAIQLKEDFKVVEKKEWDALTVLLELTVQMGQLQWLVTEDDTYEEIGRTINNKGDEIADVLLQLSALSNKLSINPEILNKEYKFISYENEGLYLDNLNVLLGQLIEAIMEHEEYRFEKGREGFGTKMDFIVDRIQKMYELTFSIAVNSNIDFNKEFLLMIEDATGFLNRYKKTHGIQ